MSLKLEHSPLNSNLLKYNTPVYHKKVCLEFLWQYGISLPQSFINQKTKEIEDEDMSEPLMQKHEQKIRHFGKCFFSNILQFKLPQTLCRFAPYYTELMLTNKRPY